MKLNKTQLQQLIKEEVVKQKTIIELEDKKVRILKELEEMDYVSEPETLQEDGELSTSEVESLLTQAISETNVDEAFMSGVGQKIKQVAGNVAKYLSPRFLASKLQNLAPEQIEQLKKFVAPFEGKSVQEINSMISNQVALQEGAVKNNIITAINTLSGMSGIGGLLSMLFGASLTNTLDLAQAELTAGKGGIMIIIAIFLYGLGQALKYGTKKA